MLGPLCLLAALAAAPADLQALGVVVSQQPAKSVAILRAGGRTRVATVGDEAFGGRVTAIVAGLVTLDFDGARVDLRLRPAAPAAAAALPPPAAAIAPAPPPAPPREAAAPPQTMERREVERRLGQEIPRILAETTAVPVMEDGHVSGIALTRIAEGSLLTEAGLRPGDVLTRINDTNIDSLATLIGLWPRLQTATELRAVVLRNGRPFDLALSLR
jgi:general secretion pathway protein C